MRSCSSPHTWSMQIVVAVAFVFALCLTNAPYIYLRTHSVHGNIVQIQSKQSHAISSFQVWRAFCSQCLLCISNATQGHINRTFSLFSSSGLLFRLWISHRNLCRKTNSHPMISPASGEKKKKKIYIYENKIGHRVSLFHFSFWIKPI